MNNVTDIRKAVMDDLPQVMDLFRSCAKAMNREGLYNWNDSYPDEETAWTDILNHEMFVLSNQRILAAVTITGFPPDEYKSVSWRYEKSKSRVIRRLAVHPDYQRNGYGTKMMYHVESLAREKGFQSIRLDVYGVSVNASLFFHELGYHERGSFYFSNHDIPCIALEKLLDNPTLTGR